MKVVNPNVCPLSNFEVYELLRNDKATKKRHGLRNVATIQYETFKFLDETNCKNLTRDAISSFLNEIQPFNLSKNECLMMVNNPPETPLHVQLIVGDSEARLLENEVNDIIDIVAKYLITRNENE